MESSNQHIIYTAADIRRYLDGRMSNEEMHAIEKAALDDPLLADAIEGYSVTEKQNWDNILAGLKNKIDTNENAPVIDIKKSAGFKWRKAAAAVLLIGTTVTVAYVLKSNKEQNTIAKSDESKTFDSSVQTAIIKADSIDEKSVAINEPPKKEKEYIAAEANSDKASGLISTEKPKASDKDFIYQPSVKMTDTEKETSATEYRKQADADDKEVVIQNAVPSAPSASNSPGNGLDNNAAAQNVQSKTANAERSVSGFNKQDAANFIKQYQLKGNVVNKDGEPVSFASVKVTTPTKQLFTTDANGFFNIPAADSILHVEVASAGYTTSKFTLNANLKNGLTLPPSNAALNEVVISSNVPKDKLAKKRVSAVDDELEETAEPTGGWESYNEYLNNNIHLPSNNQNNHGTVEAVVKVNRKGEVDDVKITQSLNDECDKEAVRLIKKGPSWKLKSGKKGYSKVKVQFNQ